MNTRHKLSTGVVTRYRMLEGEPVALPEDHVRAEAPLFWQEVHS